MEAIALEPKVTSPKTKRTAKKRTARSLRDARVRKILNETFGLKKLRDAQAEVIDGILKGQNIMAVMPTGAGKSLCYQLPGQLLEGTTVIVSPLIALMKDQNEKLHELGIESVELNSAISASDKKESLRSLKKGRAEYLYVTPERLMDDEFLKSISKMKIDMFVIDEAHCLSQWGHDFRPAFLGLTDAWRKLGKPQLLALTATATDQVIAELQELFAEANLKVIQSGVFRKNLFYEATLLEKEDEKLPALLELLKTTEGPAIVYSATVAKVEELHEALLESGINAVKYHGKMKAKDRNEAQDQFMSGEVPVIIATNAFGMGIDKQDIRLVVHFHFTGSLEAYYQESGRAGRDGKLARCSVLYLKKDKSTQSFFLAGKYPPATSIFGVYKAIEDNPGLTVTQLKEQLPSIALTKLKVILSALRASEVVTSKAKGQLHALKTGLEFQDLEAVFSLYQTKRENDREKLKQMIVYAQTALCRWKMLLSYFSQNAEWDSCEQCDNCTKPRRNVVPISNASSLTEAHAL